MVNNLDGYSMFLVTLQFIIDFLDVMGHKLLLKKYQARKE